MNRLSASAVEKDPDYTAAHLGAAALLALKGEWAEVDEHLRAARKLDPDDPQTMERLAWFLATCPVDALRDGAQALELAARADRITGGAQVRTLNTLAAAQAEAGQFGRARETVQRAIKILERANQPQAVERLTVFEKRYAEQKPYRQGSR